MMVRLAIVGTGFGARVQLPVLQALPGAEVAAISGKSLEKTKGVAASAGIRYATDRWQELLDVPDLAGVVVATPPSTHREIVCFMLSGGMHVLCEKPFGANADDARRMLRQAQDQDVIAAVDFGFRFEPGIERLRSEVNSGVIGRVIRMDVTWLTGGRADPKRKWSWHHDRSQGGGVLGGFASHVLDYVRWICGSRIMQVSAHTRILVSQRKDLCGERRTVTAEDDVDLLCMLEDGTIASVRVSDCYHAGNGHRIEVYGTKGRLIFTHTSPFSQKDASLTIEINGQTRRIGLPPLPTLPTLSTRAVQFHRLAQRFLNSIAGRQETGGLPAFQDGAEVRAALDAALESAACGRPVLVEM